MNELSYWFDVPELTQGSFLAINLSNRDAGKRAHNDSLLKQRKTGNWDIPNAVRKVSISGKTIVLFYRDIKQSTIYIGKATSKQTAGKTKSGRPRYQISIAKPWKTAGTTSETFSNFFSGFKFSSNPTCIWIDGTNLSLPTGSVSPNGFPSDDTNSGDSGSSYMAWVAQRIGHDIFAKRVKKQWGNTCALTGLSAPRLLQAC